MVGLGELLRGRSPGQLVIQITDHCNAACPQCGMNRNAGGRRGDLSPATLCRVLDHAAGNGVQAVSFTGGEPLMRRETLMTGLRHASALGFPYIRTGTNGFLFQNAAAPGFYDRVARLADALAETRLRNFWISIDSAVPGVHEAMRGLPGVVRGIEKALPIFHARGIYPSANLGINRYLGGDATACLHPAAFDSPQAYLRRFFLQFADGFDRFYRFVADLGFTIANTCYPMSADTTGREGMAPVYAASSARRLITFSRSEKAALFEALADVVSRHRWRLRIFTPRSGLHHLAAAYRDGRSSPYPCRGGVDYFFVSCDNAGTFPCGYRGSENLGPYWQVPRDAGNGAAFCDRCDWECFRDPTELSGPLLVDLRRPRCGYRHWRSDPQFFGRWAGDLAYYAAADAFDGRRPPNRSRLRWWRRRRQGPAGVRCLRPLPAPAPITESGV